MSECYPTGCPGPNDCIDFPENPADGDRECVVIDAYGTQKCWVYDKCIPGWRAEGTSPSPVEYRGGIDLTRTPRSQYPNLVAGNFFVVTTAADASTPANYPGLTATVDAGERVVYSGSDWQVVSPDLPYADEALGDVPLGDDGKPVDDSRMGGIVKNATLSQAIAGTDKCDTITPYTLQAKVDAIPAPGNGKITIKQGGNVKGEFTVNQSDDLEIEIVDADDPLIPNDGQLTITQGGQDKGSFTANQAGNTNIAIDAVNNSVITFRRDGVNIGNIRLNQSNSEIIDFGSSAPTGYGAVGSYTLASDDADVQAPGGGQLQSLVQIPVGGVFQFIQGGGPAGVWRLMGTRGWGNDGNQSIGLIVRVS